jgi:hypothetical protein
MTKIIILITLLSLFQSEKYEKIHKFSNNEGSTIGYLEGIKKNSTIYTKFRFTDSKGIVQYSIVKNKLYSEKDLDLSITAGGEFYGYKIVLLKKDYVVLSYYSNNGENVADDITIEYDYNLKKFKRLILP